MMNKDRNKQWKKARVKKHQRNKKKKKSRWQNLSEEGAFNVISFNKLIV